jgi:hypothetical protein
MPRKKIDVPPVVADVVIGLGNFLGRHAAEGLKQAKKSALREVGAALKKAGAVADAAAEEGDPDPQVIDAEFIDEKPRRRTP